MNQHTISLLFVVASFHLFGAASPPVQAQEKAAKASLAIPDKDDGLPGAGPIRRQDWFRTLWNERRADWAKRVEQDQKSLVFLGDSITQGWGDQLAKSFPGVKVANRGISGDTTRGMLIRLPEDVLALKPAGVVLLMGTNDLGDQSEPATIAGNLKLILAELKKYDAKMPVILCQVFPSSETQNRPADKIKLVNKLYAEVAKENPQVTLVETWPLFADEQGNAKVSEFPDLLHPNAVGYSKWAAALRPILATLNFLETTDDDFAVEPGFVSLFNGKDLTGWGFRDQKTMEAKGNFDGQLTSTDGRYLAKHGRVVVSTPPEGRRVQQIWTQARICQGLRAETGVPRTPNADSGVFIRKPQLQCRDYPLAGPYKSLKQYRPQDWNEMVVTVKDNVAHCTCNGEVLENALAVPPSGPIGLEGDSGQMEYRRIRIKESQ